MQRICNCGLVTGWAGMKRHLKAVRFDVAHFDVEKLLGHLIILHTPNDTEEMKQLRRKLDTRRPA